MADRKRVWVLGAGFSRSLGGPLLGYLLSEASFEHVTRLYESVFKGRPVARWVCQLYHFGTKYKYGTVHPTDRQAANGGQDIWPDAEVFLDELDGAAQAPDGPASLRIKGIVERLATFPGAQGMHHDPRQYAAMARRLVAAECCAFVKDNIVTKTEGWGPYRDWGVELSEDDTVITFNYDRVAELAAGHGNHMLTLVGQHEVAEAEVSNCGTILKLHGSVDWKWAKASDGTPYIIRDAKQPELALTTSDKEICIATPGPTKARTAEALKPLWLLAEKSLREADSVIFVGYRFPPTDAMARKKLLGAIEANEKPHIQIHTVLGENVGHPDSARLQGLIKSTCARAGRGPHLSKGYDLTAHPLRAEDFMTVWDPQRI